MVDVRAPLVVDGRVDVFLCEAALPLAAGAPVAVAVRARVALALRIRWADDVFVDAPRAVVGR